MGDYVGILFNRDLLQKIVNGKKTYERIEFYDQACKNMGIKPLFFSLADISWQKGTVCGYIPAADGSLYRRKEKIPSAIHNRGMFFGKKLRQKLCKLAARPDTTVFNRQNRYSKLTINRILAKREELRDHIPPTERLSRKTLREWIERYPSVYIKQNSSSVGKGIVRIDRLSGGKRGYRIRFGVGKRAVRVKGYSPSRLFSVLHPYLKNARRFHVQQGVPLAKVDGRPFDIRVSVQKNEEGRWAVTGMVAKLAGKGKCVTNLARGGKAMPVEKALAKAVAVQNPQDVLAKVSELALAVCKRLDKKLGGFADVGLDIGVDAGGFPYLIEVNGRDLRYSFAKAGRKDLWRKTFAMPMRYAAYLLQREKER
ncbi:hypothetical protein BSNK01_14040 [Bacillaceae bacterium]